MAWLHGLPLIRRRTLWVWPSMALLLCLTVAAAFAQPTNGNYRLGPGDRITIKVFGEPDLSMDVQIDDTGRVNYPFLGELVVQGLTVGQLERRITRGLEDGYLRKPAVTVAITEYRPFFLTGEVQKPGGIPYQPNLTVEQAIALGGGFTERASRSDIEVIRAGDPEHKSVRVRLSDPVYPGDTIIVKRSFF